MSDSPEPVEVVGPAKRLPPWLAIARAELGVREISGSEHNPRIIEYHRATSLGASDDETPWCSSFNNWVFVQAGYPGTNSAAARSWLNWGRALSEPCVGAVAILARGSEPWMAHVGIITEFTATSIKVLGGNQGNRVSEVWYCRDHVLGYRWPKELHASKTVAAALAAGTAQTALQQLPSISAPVVPVVPQSAVHSPSMPAAVPLPATPPSQIVEPGMIEQLQSMLPITSGTLRVVLVTVTFVCLGVVVYERWLKNKNGTIG